jgi:hypothetical protein
MSNKTQKQMYYTAHDKSAATNRAFLEMFENDPPTKTEFDAMLKTRPSLWGRFAKFRDQMPDSRDKAVILHDLTDFTVKTVRNESECTNEHELSIYRTCLERLDVITMGCLIAEPIQ